MLDSRIPGSSAEHPFAPYIRILGKGKTGTRSLQQDEAREAFRMILRGETEALQTGAFLMLLRIKRKRRKNSLALSRPVATLWWFRR